MSARIQFRNYLPALFRAGEVNGVSLLSRFLNAFELLFEGLEAEIEGNRDPATGNVTGGGIPDLFSMALSPPAQFPYRQKADADNPDPDFDFLIYLASWLGLSLRPDPVRLSGETDAAYYARRLALNQQFFSVAMSVYPRRGTFSAIEAMLRAWLTGELLPTVPPAPPPPIMTEQRSPHTDVGTVFQVGTSPGATLGFDTVLGDGPPYFFLVDLQVAAQLAFRQPAAIDTIQRAARFLLDSEKPAHTHYQLCVRAHTMQLGAPGEVTINGQPAAQLSVTTLVWDKPWLYNSD